jgi:class 3 adenylate cyclase
MGADDEGTLAQLHAHRQALVDPKFSEHRGRIVKTTGDGMLVEFASVVDALLGDHGNLDRRPESFPMLAEHLQCEALPLETTAPREQLGAGPTVAALRRFGGRLVADLDFSTQFVYPCINN